MTTVSHSPLVVWHDVECGSYRADMALWHELAATARGPLLDVGAGTGRVALELARAGHDVTALDRERELLDALEQRARLARLDLAIVAADAADLPSARGFALVLVPMQTVQLLPERAPFLLAARRALAPGGLLALAIVTELEDFGDLSDAMPEPDVGEHDGWRFESQPTAVRAVPGATRIERVRRAIAPDGTVTETGDAIELAHVTAAGLEAEGRSAGLTPLPARTIPPTEEHVGSEVVLLRA